jgi:phosphoglycolate phosphatase
MIGDRHFDIDAARANGIRSIGITWGIGDRAELADAEADLVVERPSELVELLAVRHL